MYIFHASPEGRTGVSSYTGEGRHLGGVIGIPWPGSEAGLGVHFYGTNFSSHEECLQKEATLSRVAFFSY